MGDVWTSAATLHEAMGRRGVLPPRIKPVHAHFRVSGPAFPVRCPAGSNLPMHQALYTAAPGDVLLVTVDGADDTVFGYFGEVMAVAAKARGLAGLVIDAGVRDAEQLEEVAFPVFAAGLSIRGTEKHPHADPFPEAVELDGTTVRRGDLLVGDADGVVCVPAAEIETAFAAGRARDDKEAGLMDQLRGGARTLDLMNLPAYVSGGGCVSARTSAPGTGRRATR